MSAWQTMETAPRDGTVILRPHRIWGAMDVRYKPTRIDDGSRSDGAVFEWLNGDYTTAWPDEAFLPFWMPLPDPPTPEQLDALKNEVSK